MRLRLVGLAIAALAGAYVASPYVALYQFGCALHRGDVKAVSREIAWDQLRAGIAADVAANFANTPPQPQARVQLASNDLPAFGSGFVTSIATHEVDERLTPQAIAAMATPAALSAQPGLEQVRLAHAFFTSPTSFDVALRTASGEHLKLRMELIGDDWKITRAWLPMDMLEGHHPT
jgi:hypothetical protein